MKKEFIGFYEPSKEEIDGAWESGIFAFDANALLNLYRYSDQTRKDFLLALLTIKDRLFLPHQAAFEFHSNRNSVIEATTNSYACIERVLVEIFENRIKPQIDNYRRHPSITVDKIYSLYFDFQRLVSEELDKQKRKQPNFRDSDSVLDKITESFTDSSIGREFSSDALKRIYVEGESRYQDKIPPGYMDQESKKKNGQRHIYGDLIIWKELIEFCKDKTRPFIFITDDRKEDWWRKENGRTIRPREDLIKEFHDLTGLRLLMYSSDSFLYIAKERNLLPKIKEKTIEEVKQIRKTDETRSISSEQDIWNPSQYMPQNDRVMSGEIFPSWYKTINRDLFPKVETLQAFEPLAEKFRRGSMSMNRNDSLSDLMRAANVFSHEYRPLNERQDAANVFKSTSPILIHDLVPKFNQLTSSMDLLSPSESKSKIVKVDNPKSETKKPTIDGEA
ncbi:MAG: PIN-like domain-containing protein [Flavobacteriales bacterium]